MHSPRSARQRPDLGALLRDWRTARRLSQLNLALKGEISARHLSFLETARSRPSRELLLHLTDTLEIPLRERNLLLAAAGFAPTYLETDLAAPEMAQVRTAIELILGHQEPYPAFVVDRCWEVRLANQAAGRLTRFLLGGDSSETNMLRTVLRPDGVRRFMANWEDLAGDLIRHLHHHIAASPSDARARALLADVLAYPGVPARWRTREIGRAAPPLLTTVFQKDGRELRFFSTLTSFGTPHDVTLEELRIECNFPADEATAAFCRELTTSGSVDASNSAGAGVPASFHSSA